MKYALLKYWQNIYFQKTIITCMVSITACDVYILGSFLVYWFFFFVLLKLEVIHAKLALPPTHCVLNVQYLLVYRSHLCISRTPYSCLKLRYYCSASYISHTTIWLCTELNQVGLSWSPMGDNRVTSEYFAFKTSAFDKKPSNFALNPFTEHIRPGYHASQPLVFWYVEIKSKNQNISKLGVERPETLHYRAYLTKIHVILTPYISCTPHF